MKYELRHRSGKFNGQHWDKEWDLVVKGKTIFAGNIRIGIISTYTDAVAVSLDEIPARVDLESNGDIWLQNEDDVKLHPKPYKAVDKNTSRVVWQKGEREQANKIKVSDTNNKEALYGWNK